MLSGLLEKRSLRLSLAVISLISLTGYAFPFVTKSLLSPRASWAYHYTETLFSNGSLVYEFNADWEYWINSLYRDTFIIEVNGTVHHRYFLKNGSYVTFNWTDHSWLFVNAKTRMYGQGYYTSWWIPTNIYFGDTVPVWNLNLRVIGLAWVMINGQLIECWVLKYERPREEYTFLYERTTGLFVKMVFKRTVGKSQLTAERRITNMSFRWPLLALMRPFLILIAIAAIIILAVSYREDLKRFLKKPEKIPVIL